MDWIQGKRPKARRRGTPAARLDGLLRVLVLGVEAGGPLGGGVAEVGWREGLKLDAKLSGAVPLGWTATLGLR